MAVSGTADAFHFVWTSQSGDVTFAAHVDAQTNNAYGKVAVIVCGSTNPSAPFYDLAVSPQTGLAVQYRDGANGQAANLAAFAPGPGTQAPLWLAVARTVGATGLATYSAYTSTDGKSWTLIPSSALVFGSLTGNVLAGVAGASHNTGASSTVTVDQLRLTTGGTGACPTSWTCQDIGSPALAGTQSTISDGAWTVAGAGNDIWGTSDQFHYVSQPQTGDFSLTARVSAQTNSAPWAKAGLMVRASSDPSAAYYAVLVTPGNGIVAQYRAATGASAAWPGTASGSAPTYVKVTRIGRPSPATPPATG